MRLQVVPVPSVHVATGAMASSEACGGIRQVFTDSQVHHVLKQVLGDESWQLLRCDFKPASEGITGFLGDHYRATLHVQVGETIKTVQLFVKTMPMINKNKAAFIDQGNFFRRERLTFQVFENVGGDHGPNPWRTKAYIFSENLLVMPDQTAFGYTQCHYLHTLDLPHVLTVAASIARFHATYANFATKKSWNRQRPYNFLDEYGHLMKEPTFYDSPWLRGCGKLSTNLLYTFSKKYNNVNFPNLEEQLIKLFIESSDNFRDYDDTLNVLVHRDLWLNNIMFKYADGVPVNALLLDFQCLRYGPPAFDLNMFLYMTTTRNFREQNEREVFEHYYSVFTESLNDATKQRLKNLGYTREEFLSWCEKSRMFGMVLAIGIFPYVLMSPVAASRYFDDPLTFDRYLEDRTEPVIEYCKQCPVYRDRQVDTIEEFVERYIENKR